MNTTQKEKINIHEMTAFLLDTGVFMMASGAHSGRVCRNCNRIATYWGFTINVKPTYTGMLITVSEADDAYNSVTRFQTAPPSVIHLAILSKVSHLSWRVSDGDLSFAQAKVEFDKIRTHAHYSYGVIALAVGISCGMLTKLAGGNYMDVLFAFGAASVGSVSRYIVVKNNYNLFFAIIVAAFISSFIAGFDTIFKLGAMPEMALATSVLYLIPGVPLLNSVIDLLEGYYSASLTRGLFAASIVFCIAIGMTMTITLLGISNF